MTDRLDGQVVIVTGAGRGAGAAIALALAAAGASVAANDINPDRAEATARAIQEAGGKALAIDADVSNRFHCVKLIESTRAEWSRLDLLVNQAHVSPASTVLKMDEWDWDRCLDVNLKGTFFMSQQLGRHLVQGHRPGCVINIASAHGVLGFAQRTTYAISKAGIIHMTRMLAYEWADHGIRLNAVAPGTVETKTRAEYFNAYPQARQAMMDRIPVHRFGTPEEVGAAVSYLASPAAAYITGQTLLLDGGLTSY